MSANLIPIERIEQRILLIRGQKVILDTDLANLYGVTTKRLNEQVKRNSNRFPKHFMFQLTNQEFTSLRSQFATTKYSKRRMLPYAFTEHGTLQAANVLNSDKAVQVSITIIEAFIRLRQLAAEHVELIEKLLEHEEKIGYLFALLEELTTSPQSDDYNTHHIGFNRDEK